MRRPIGILLLTFACLASLPAPAAAQAAPQQFVEVKLRDGSKLYGTVVSDESGRLVLRTVAGADVSVARDQVESIHPTAGEVVKGEFWPNDPIASKLFLGPTGRSLKRGEGYLAIDSLFLPVFQVGVTDRFSIGLGAPFYGFVKTAWITPKFQLYRDERTAVSTGVLHLFVPDFGLGGYGYVVATRGTPNGAVTFGGGVLYGRDEGESETLPMFTVGGERRIGRRTKFVTENYIFKEGAIAAAGVRILGQTISTEVGCLAFIGDGDALPGFFFNFVFHGRPNAGR
jgi:hypothetical protein